MAWTTVGNIKGPKGDTGEEGPEGPQGPKGEDGAGISIAGSVATYGDLPDDLGSEDAGDGYLVQADGLLYIWDGEDFPSDGNGVAFQGPEGPSGAAGADGDDGMSAYEVAVDNGFVGSESAWLASLVGPQGTTGETGADGASAYEVAVDDGFEGTESEWLESLIGEKGDTGDTGSAGSPGAPGEPGATGPRGSKWFTGTGAPGSIGGSVVGDMYLDTATGDTYELE